MEKVKYMETKKKKVGVKKESAEKAVVEVVEKPIEKVPMRTWKDCVCGECVYFTLRSPDNTPRIKKKGICRRNPPGDVAYPRQSFDELACGEFKEQ